ncbi:Kinase, CAMKK [Giardia muris]|uniref:Kinase, CAMKK n=1 Tax=Giardia muris TaxID=5742 RepID=A0A4Z1SWT3_GIAMU|nr:Kinase, CAMKK [Giardia muris]|eukprot:TNJ30186.1 Kinase, CAMKK [Giardia muris]
MPPSRPGVDAGAASSYVFGQCIGRGSFGSVYYCIDKETGREYAVKVMSKRYLAKQFFISELPDDLSDDDDDDKTPPNSIISYLDLAYQEIETMKKFRHPCLLRLHEVVQSARMDKLLMVMDLAEGPISTVIVRNEHLNQLKIQRLQQIYQPSDLQVLLDCSCLCCTPMPLPFLYKVIIHVTLGLLVLHNANYVHADIKAANILRMSNGTFVLGDFSLTNHVRRTRAISAVVSSAYASPDNRGLTKENDIWAFGITLFMLLFGRHPASLCWHILLSQCNTQTTIPEGNEGVEGVEGIEGLNPGAGPGPVDFGTGLGPRQPTRKRLEHWSQALKMSPDAFQRVLNSQNSAGYQVIVRIVAGCLDLDYRSRLTVQQIYDIIVREYITISCFRIRNSATLHLLYTFYKIQADAILYGQISDEVMNGTKANCKGAQIRNNLWQAAADRRSFYDAHMQVTSNVLDPLTEMIIKKNFSLFFIDLLDNLNPCIVHSANLLISLSSLGRDGDIDLYLYWKAIRLFLLGLPRRRTFDSYWADLAYLIHNDLDYRRTLASRTLPELNLLSISSSFASSSSSSPSSGDTDEEKKDCLLGTISNCGALSGLLDKHLAPQDDNLELDEDTEFKFEQRGHYFVEALNIDFSQNFKFFLMHKALMRLHLSKMNHARISLTIKDSLQTLGTLDCSHSGNDHTITAFNTSMMSGASEETREGTVQKIYPQFARFGLPYTSFSMENSFPQAGSDLIGQDIPDVKDYESALLSRDAFGAKQIDRGDLLATCPVSGPELKDHPQDLNDSNQLEGDALIQTYMQSFIPIPRGPGEQEAAAVARIRLEDTISGLHSEEVDATTPFFDENTVGSVFTSTERAISADLLDLDGKNDANTIMGLGSFSVTETRLKKSMLAALVESKKSTPMSKTQTNRKIESDSSSYYSDIVDLEGSDAYSSALDSTTSTSSEGGSSSVLDSDASDSIVDIDNFVDDSSTDTSDDPRNFISVGRTGHVSPLRRRVSGFSESLSTLNENSTENTGSYPSFGNLSHGHLLPIRGSLKTGVHSGDFSATSERIVTSIPESSDGQFVPMIFDEHSSSSPPMQLHLNSFTDEGSVEENAIMPLGTSTEMPIGLTDDVNNVVHAAIPLAEQHYILFIVRSVVFTFRITEYFLKRFGHPILQNREFLTLSLAIRKDITVLIQEGMEEQLRREKKENDGVDWPTQGAQQGKVEPYKDLQRHTWSIVQLFTQWLNVFHKVLREHLCLHHVGPTILSHTLDSMLTVTVYNYQEFIAAHHESRSGSLSQLSDSYTLNASFSYSEAQNDCDPPSPSLLPNLSSLQELRQSAPKGGVMGRVPLATSGHHERLTSGSSNPCIDDLHDLGIQILEPGVENTLSSNAAAPDCPRSSQTSPTPVHVPMSPEQCFRLSHLGIKPEKTLPVSRTQSLDRLTVYEPLRASIRNKFDEIKERITALSGKLLAASAPVTSEPPISCDYTISFTVSAGPRDTMHPFLQSPSPFLNNGPSSDSTDSIDMTLHRSSSSELPVLRSPRSLSTRRSSSNPTAALHTSSVIVSSDNETEETSMALSSSQDVNSCLSFRAADRLSDDKMMKVDSPSTSQQQTPQSHLQNLPNSLQFHIRITRFLLFGIHPFMKMTLDSLSARLQQGELGLNPNKGWVILSADDVSKYLLFVGISVNRRCVVTKGQLHPQVRLYCNEKVIIEPRLLPYQIYAGMATIDISEAVALRRCIHDVWVNVGLDAAERSPLVGIRHNTKERQVYIFRRSTNGSVRVPPDGSLPLKQSSIQDTASISGRIGLNLVRAFETLSQQSEEQMATRLGGLDKSPDAMDVVTVHKYRRNVSTGDFFTVLYAKAPTPVPSAFAFVDLTDNYDYVSHWAAETSNMEQPIALMDEVSQQPGTTDLPWRSYVPPSDPEGTVGDEPYAHSFDAPAFGVSAWRFSMALRRRESISAANMSQLFLGTAGRGRGVSGLFSADVSLSRDDDSLADYCITGPASPHDGQHSFFFQSRSDASDWVNFPGITPIDQEHLRLARGVYNVLETATMNEDPTLQSLCVAPNVYVNRMNFEDHIFVPVPLLEVLVDFILNARQYSQPSVIRAALFNCQNSLYLIINDCGIGLPKQCWDHPFFRISSDFTDLTKGYGTGLAKAVMVTKAYGGTVNVSTCHNGGTRLILRIPLPNETVFTDV